MSNRSLIEINHDYCPRHEDAGDWADSIRLYLMSGDTQFLPEGVTLKATRHHAEPEFDLKSREKCPVCGDQGCSNCRIDLALKLREQFLVQAARIAELQLCIEHALTTIEEELDRRAQIESAREAIAAVLRKKS